MPYAAAVVFPGVSSYTQRGATGQQVNHMPLQRAPLHSNQDLPPARLKVLSALKRGHRRGLIWEAPPMAPLQGNQNFPPCGWKILITVERSPLEGHVACLLPGSVRHCQSWSLCLAAWSHVPSVLYLHFEAVSHSITEMIHCTGSLQWAWGVGAGCSRVGDLRPEGCSMWWWV